MATTSLLKTNPLIRKQCFSIPSPSPRLMFNNPSFTLKAAKSSATLKAQGFAKFGVRSLNESSSSSSCMSPFEVHATTLRFSDKENPTSMKNPFVDIAYRVLEALEALKKPAVVAVWIGLLLMHNPHPALAASGGRMGGTSFSSRSSSSSSSGSSSSSSSSSSSHRSSASSSWSSDSSYSSSSSPSSSPWSESSSFRSRPSTSRSSASSYSSSSSPSSSPWSESSSFRSGPSTSPNSKHENEQSVLLLIFILFMGVYIFRESWQMYLNSISILKLQVGLLGTARSLESDLNKICETADTSSATGLSYILTETTLSLLRHPHYWISGYSSGKVTLGPEDAEHFFNKLSIVERGKIDEETLVNVDNKKIKSKTNKKNDEFNNEYIVVTILVAAAQWISLPKINGDGDLTRTLRLLGSIPSSSIQAVEVLWTPQVENDNLSEEELQEKYPHLRPL